LRVTAAARLRAVEVGEPHGADELSVALQAGMVTRDLRPADVAFVGEGGGLPFDGLGDAIVCPEDDVPGLAQQRVERVIGQPAASQHLRVLREAGLVQGRVDGRRRLYRVDIKGLERLRRELDAYWGPALAALKKAAEAADQR
jgi:DNA-binding transcriptional ArsR family regulator